MLSTLQIQIRENEATLSTMMPDTPELEGIRSLPGMEPTLAAVVVNETRRHQPLPQCPEALWLRRTLPLHQQQRRQDLPRQAHEQLQPVVGVGDMWKPLGWR
jgi:hypothetical protein